MQYSQTPASAQLAAPGAPEGAALGIYGKSSTPPSLQLIKQSSAFAFDLLTVARADVPAPPTAPVERAAYTRVSRYALQDMAADILPGQSLAGCTRWKAYGTDGSVPFSYSKNAQRARLHNLQTCKKLWVCPVCAARISERRRREMQALIAAHKAAGGSVYLLTLTFPHGPRDALPELLDRLKVAERKFKAGKPWERLAERFGLLGTIRSLEATYGANGWHPHIHSLVFTQGKVDADAFADAFYGRWTAACDKAGLPAPSRAHGVDVQAGDYAAAYVSKWGIENEMTKWHAKEGRGGSFTPFDLLRVALHTESKPARSAARLLFATYADAFKGRRQLVATPALLKRYEVDMASDEEAADDVADDEMIFGSLTPEGWRSVLGKKLRGPFVEAVRRSQGQFAVVAAYVEEAFGKGKVEQLLTELVPFPVERKQPDPLPYFDEPAPSALLDEHPVF